MAQLHAYSTVTRAWHNYSGMAQLHGKTNTIIRVWHSYMGMAQLPGIAQLYGHGTITRV